MTRRVQTAIRFDADTMARVDALVARMVGATRSGVIRAAIERGLDALEREYPPPRRRRK